MKTVADLIAFLQTQDPNKKILMEYDTFPVPLVVGESEQDWLTSHEYGDTKEYLVFSHHQYSMNKPLFEADYE